MTEQPAANFQQPKFIDGPHGKIAYRTIEGGGPGVVWLGGFRSDMLGTKAEFISELGKKKRSRLSAI